MNWCSLLNMWCSDVEDEEFEMNDCFGDCRNCEYREIVNQQN